jgi:glycerol-3-phosphate dehydrogenase (NAD(P)+)
MRVTVLGGGSWGTTVASLVAERNDTVLWARDPDVAEEVNKNHANSRYLGGTVLASDLRATADLEEAVRHAQLLVVGVPSHAFRGVVGAAAPYVEPWIPIVSLTKGLEAGTLMRMTEIIGQELAGHPAAALTGPNIAREIMAGMAAAAVVATEDLSVARAVQSVMAHGLYRVYLNHDVVGCELGGALKNVVAIAAGMGEGLAVGDNTRAAIITRGLAELTRLGSAMGGEPATFAGLTGLGDMLVTCISPHSRNRRVGELLGRGVTLADILGGMNMVAEGVKTVQVARDLAAREGIEVPICTHIGQVVDGEITAAGAYDGLRLPPAGHESDPA